MPNVAADSDGTFNKQLGSLFLLPSDILTEIFAYLGQKDCMVCLAVCRDWQLIIPEYTQSVWRSIRLNQLDADRDHLILKRCFGGHVKSVSIEPSQEDSDIVEEHKLCTLLRKLHVWGCANIESIELDICEVVDHVTFLNLLTALAPKLTRLLVRQAIFPVDILSILYALPELTHFSCQYISPTGEPSIPPSAVSAEFCTKIKYLWLQIDLTTDQREAVIKRCPDLRCYTDTSFNIRSTDFIVGFETLFLSCPNITFVETSNTLHFDDYSEHDSNRIGLCCFHPSSAYTYHQVVQQIRENQDTLEHLSIDNRDEEEDWSSVFTSFRLPRLLTLYSSNNHLTFNAFLAVLHHSPALETLFIYCPTILHINSSLTCEMGQLLQTLHLDSVLFNKRTSLLKILDLLPALETLTISNASTSLEAPNDWKGASRLKHLTLTNITWVVGQEFDEEAAVTNFLKHLTINSKIKSVWINKVPMPGSTPLYTLAKISTMNKLTITLENQVDEDTLLKFLVMLRETAIETLALRKIPNLPFQVLSAIAALPFLVDISLEMGRSHETPIHISSKGLQIMLTKCRYLESVLLFHNTVVIYDGDQSLTSSQVTSLIDQNNISNIHPNRRWDVEIKTNRNHKRIHRIDICRSLPSRH